MNAKQAAQAIVKTLPGQRLTCTESIYKKYCAMISVAPSYEWILGPKKTNYFLYLRFDDDLISEIQLSKELKKTLIK